MKATTNIQTTDCPVTQVDYADHLLAMMHTLTVSKSQGRVIDLTAALSQLDPDQNNSSIRDWMDRNHVATKSKFDKTLEGIRRNTAIRAALGFVPQNAEDFVTQHVAAEGIQLLPTGTLKRQRAYPVGDMAITAENAHTDATTQLMFDVANADGDNVDTLARELRLLNDTHKLGYRDSTISDAIAVWQEDTNRRTRVSALAAIQFEKGLATGPVGQEMWQVMEAACFDVRDTAPGFAVSVIKKFMWQVKRKSRKMPITNHLMPVITGPQGKGKSQFVHQMTAPLADLMRAVNFELLTDGKTTDIWSSPILFLDEMGYFSNANTEAVKNVITATEQTIRTMRQNSSVPVRNAATLIGCSNKSLGQLVRDDTGLRRFAELPWSTSPDWNASNQVDWRLLWRSVDETAPDPMVLAGTMELLKAQQEGNRNQSPVETWAREPSISSTGWQSVAQLHEQYREWEQNAFPHSHTNRNMFGRNLSNLIETMPEFPFEKQRRASGICYRYRGLLELGKH